MRILFLTLTPPYPPTSGHRLRTWSMVRALAREGHEVTVLGFAESQEELVEGSPLRELCRDVELMPMPQLNQAGPPQYARRARAALSPLPYGAWRFRSRRLRRRVEELGEDGFDAILCDGVYNMVNVPPSVRAPVLLNKDDVAHVIVERYLALERNPLKRVYGWLESRKVRAWERRACEQVKAVLASSEVDRAILHRLCPQAQIAVVPNTVDTDLYRAVPEGSDPVVLYQGGMDWHPNRDAVEFFVTDILPELRRLRPGLRFRVAGRSPAEAFRRRFSGIPEIEFTGSVADMRDEIAQASVCAVPLRIGSGTRLKILEAGAMAKPIVSTRLGAEGLGFRDGEEIVLADEPKLFARRVAELLADPSRRRRLGLAARCRVEEEHSFPVLASALKRALEVAVR